MTGTGNGKLLAASPPFLIGENPSNVDSNYYMKLTNENSKTMVNTRKSGEFYEALSTKGILRRE